MDELRRIATAPRVVAQTRRRTNTYLVLEQIHNGNKNKALAGLSNSVLSLSAETGRDGANLLDAYREALVNPAPSALNAFERIIADEKAKTMRILTR
jgi:hypothetical protein